jgi:hypothetical protein
MYQPILRTQPSSMAPSWILPAVVVAAGAGGLVITNPGANEFADFAGHRLVHLITREICVENTLPLSLRLLLQNCPELVASQQQVLGRIALQNTRRINLGVASFYRTELGGQQLLPNLQIPRYRALTLAAAGQFVVVSTGESRQR